MTYTAPDKPADAKPRYAEVTDLDLISAIQRSAFADPIGHEHEGKWYAEVGSLKAYRERLQSADSATWICPECKKNGFPSVHGNYCTNCSNIKRGYSSHADGGES